MSNRGAAKEFSAGRRGFGYVLLSAFAVMLLSALYIGVKLLIMAFHGADLSLTLRAIMVAAAALALYAPVRVGFAMLKRRRGMNRRG